MCQVSRYGASERRPSGHSDGLSGGAGTTRSPAPAHRHRTLQTKINIRISACIMWKRERNWARICKRLWRAQESGIPTADAAWRGPERKIGLAGQPGWESIPGLCKRHTNTGSVLMQAYFFVMPHPQFCVIQGIFSFYFWLNKKTLFPCCENWILHNVRMCVCFESSLYQLHPLSWQLMIEAFFPFCYCTSCSKNSQYT